MNMYASTTVNVKQNKKRKRKKFKNASKLIRALIKRSNRNNRNIDEPITESTGIPNKQKRSISDFLTYMIRQYEGVDVLMDISSELLKGSESIFKNKPRVRKSLSFLGKALPFSIGAYDFYKKSEMYFKDGKFESTRNKYMRRIASHLDLEELHGIGEYSLGLSKEVFLWLMGNPETKFFRIERIFDFSEDKDVEYSENSEGGKLFIKFEWKAKKYLWGIQYRNTMLGPQVQDARIYSDNIDDIIAHDLNQDIMKDYVKSFDIKKNSIILYPDSIETKPRCSKLHEINQFHIPGFKKEIRKILKLKKKRAYAFVGLPGTGKTSIIMRLEKELDDVPFIYVSPRCVNYEGAITHLFNVIRTLQPCIVVFEDLDSFDFGNKDSKLGVFLNEIDDVRGDLQAVFLATINDTNRVHYSLINRPGRFDKVILVKPPQTKEEVYSVMGTRFGKEVGKFYQNESKTLVDIDSISEDFFQRTIQNSLTQVDICEIIDSALLHHDLLGTSQLVDSLNSILTTKQNITLCNFKNKDPNTSYIDEYDGPSNDECCPVEANSTASVDLTFIKE